MLGLVAALVNNPFFLALVEFSLKVVVVFANHTLNRIVVAVSDVVSTLGYFSGAFNVVSEQSESVRSEVALADFGVELSIFVCAVLPLFEFLFLLLLAVDVLQVVVEEVLAIDQFASVPLGHITTLFCNCLENLLRLGRSRCHPRGTRPW